MRRLSSGEPADLAQPLVCEPLVEICRPPRPRIIPHPNHTDVEVAEMYEVAESGRGNGRAELLANERAALLAAFQKVEQTAPLRHGAAAWAWGFWTLRKSEEKSVEKQVFCRNLPILPERAAVTRKVQNPTPTLPRRAARKPFARLFGVPQ